MRLPPSFKVKTALCRPFGQPPGAGVRRRIVIGSLALALVGPQFVAALAPLLEMLRVVLALPTVELVFLRIFLHVATAIVPPGEGKRLVLMKRGSAMPGGIVLRESRRCERGDQGEGEQREHLPHCVLLLPRAEGRVN
ncbi:MAG: hypothetical protein HY271_16855 [Deltaproteobacteria bacterium]|nr:hypothetical protein [Deltaproteobacteria bacterium]